MNRIINIANSSNPEINTTTNVSENAIGWIKYVGNIPNYILNHPFFQFILENPVILSALVTALVTLIGIYITLKHIHKKDHGFKSYFEYNKKYAEIRSQLPIWIFSDDPSCLETLKKRNDLMNLMWQYFDLCYEEYYLVKGKKYIENDLWQEWTQGIEYHMGKPAFKYTWDEYLKARKINPKVIGEDDRLKPNNHSKLVCFMKKVIRKRSEPNYFLKFVYFINEQK